MLWSREEEIVDETELPAEAFRQKQAFKAQVAAQVRRSHEPSALSRKPSPKSLYPSYFPLSFIIA